MHAGLRGGAGVNYAVFVLFFNLYAKTSRFSQNPLYSVFTRWYTAPEFMLKLNKIRHVIASVIILATLYLVVTLVLKANDSGKRKEGLPDLPRNVDLSLKKIHYTETKDGVRKWDLFAETGDVDKKSEVTKLSGVRLVLPGDAKSGEITLSADHADYFNTTKDVNLYGKVEARSVSGMEFSTERALYKAVGSLITTADPIRFSDGRLTVEGVGMEFSVTNRDVKILHQVKTTIRTGKKG